MRLPILVQVVSIVLMACAPSLAATPTPTKPRAEPPAVPASSTATPTKLAPSPTPPPLPPKGTQATPTPATTKTAQATGGAAEATATGQDKLGQLRTPFWSAADVEDALVKLFQGHYTSYVGFLKDPGEKPPFYNHPGPFEYVNYYGKDPFFPMEVLLAQEFKVLGFHNVFVSSSPVEVPKGAVTIRAGGRIAAEARFLRDLEDQDRKFKGFELEEVHYAADGKPVFRSKSQFDELFYKIGETETVGKKSAEYYFVWPVRLMR